MRRTYLQCEFENCGNDAEVFCLSETRKVKSCSYHISAIFKIGTQLFDISAYYFPKSPEGAMLTWEQKNLKASGYSNLAMLEESCEYELETALIAIENAREKVIRAAEDRFDEMKVAMTMASFEVKADLAQLRMKFEQFFISKEDEVSLTEFLIDEEMKTVPLPLRFGLADTADRVSAVLSDSWQLNSSDIHSMIICLDTEKFNTTMQDALTEAAVSAQKGIPQALRYASLLSRTFDEEKAKVLLELVNFEKRQNQENFKWLQRSWDLRQ